MEKDPSNTSQTRIPVTAAMRPRANTISHVDNATMQLIAAANAQAARACHHNAAGIPPHPITGRVLRFRDGKRLKTWSYVKLNGEHEWFVEALRPYEGCGYVHKVQWHKGMSREEFDIYRKDPRSPAYQQHFRQLEENKKSEEKIAQTSKPCPWCGRNIEKNGGW